MYLIFLNIKLTLTGRVVIIWHYLALSPVIQDARKTTNDSNSSSSVISDGSEEGASVGRLFGRRTTVINIPLIQSADPKT